MSLVFPQELTHVTAKARERYRPLKWRGILPVESAPTWAQFVEDRKQRSFIEEPINVTHKGPTEELPEPALSVSSSTIKLYNFGYAYSYTNDEIEYAAKVGIALTSEKVDVVNLGAEQFLETVAASGHTLTGMLGLNSLTDTTAVTAVTKAATGTTWAVATSIEMVRDLHAIADGVLLASKETQTADTIVMPLAQYQLANVVMSSALERTPFEIFRAQRPEIKRILVWNKLTAGTMFAWDSTDQYGPKMLISRELTYGQPLQLLTGWRVPAQMKLAGLVCRNRTAVCKMTGL